MTPFRCKLTYLCTMIVFSRVISYLFHPLFLFFYLVVISYFMDPFAYHLDGPKALGLLFIMSFFTLILFPVVTILLLKALNFIPSIQMPEREHRIAPLIGISVFYIWYFVNIKNNVAFPETLSFIALGGAIAVGLAFFINNFSKISLHAVGAGAFLMGIGILIFYKASPMVRFDFGSMGAVEISSTMLLMTSLLLAGMICTARLYLGAHKTDDLYGGFIVGSVAQLIAFNVIL